MSLSVPIPSLAQFRPGKPLLKWAGGKSQLLPELRRIIPARFTRYVEPFLGGGALFWNLALPGSWVNDSNPELVHFCSIVRDEPEVLLETISEMPLNRDHFYHLRSLGPEEMDPVERAARFIYLNKTCYNGLYRVNRQGVFNTPFGGRSDVKIVERASLMNASALLRACTLTQEDFEVILDHACPGDFVYIDPPYWPLEGYADFKRYTRDFFGKEDHRRLAACFRRLSDRGIKALLSNSSCPEVKNLYRGFHQVEVSATRQINCISTKRGKIKELLVTNYPLETENVFS